MFNLRHLIRPLVVIALLATSLALAVSSPAGAQSSIRVITFESAENDDNWEVQITVQSLGGCNPANAQSGHVTGWLAPGDQDGEVLDPGVCNYRITAVARQVDASSQLCEAELKWSTGNFGTSLQTSSRPPNDATVEAQHTGGATPSCSAQPTLAITIDAADVVQPLPTSATDSSIKARAERAAEITEFRIRVTPKSTSVNRTGCNQTLDFLVAGDGEEVEKALGSLGSGVTCEYRIAVTYAPPPFVIRDKNGVSFSTADKNINTGKIDLDLSEHVLLPWNRIVIIQDVVNNPGNQGSAAYSITSVCAGVAALPPIVGPGGSGIYTTSGGQTVASLDNRRATVHSPDFANFGVGASYPAVATSTTSSEIGGCSVTASVSGLPDNCSLAGSNARTLSWTTANPLQHFDFEFDISCGGTQPSEPPVPPPTPSSGDPSPTSTVDTSTAAEDGTPNVRIVARLREDGKIEFGLQQVQRDTTWSDRVFPRARLFPATTSVGRWLVSSAITLSASESAESFDEDLVVRIVARKLQDGRVEFGLQQEVNGSWGDREFPNRRFFPRTATVDRWLGSSTLTLDL